MSEVIKFYMKRVDIPNQKEMDLEVDFKGLRYVKAVGIDDIGDSRIYEEKYAESNTVNVYIPKVLVNEPTVIDITFYFLGANRRKTYDAFTEYIRQGMHQYWDTKRKKRFTFYVKDKIKPSEEKWFGSNPYLEVTYKLKNINGKTENVK